MYMEIKHILQGRMSNLQVERGGRPFLMPKNNASNKIVSRDTKSMGRT